MKFYHKILLLVLLSFITIIFLLPLPWQRKDLYVDENDSVNFKTVLPNFNSVINVLFSSFDVPSEIKYYSLHIKNLNGKYDYIYRLTIDENDPILPYLENKIGLSNKEFGIDKHPAIIIKPGDNFIIAIPTYIPLVNHFGKISVCGTDGLMDSNGRIIKCPSINEEYWPENLEVYATPNLASYIAVSILIFAFWVVIINNFYDFFIKKNT